MTTATPEREQAATIRKKLNEQLDAIRAQKNLTPKGKKARIAKAFVDGRDKLTELRHAESQRLATD